MKAKEAKKDWILHSSKKGLTVAILFKGHMDFRNVIYYSGYGKEFGLIGSVLSDAKACFYWSLGAELK